MKKLPGGSFCAGYVNGSDCSGGLIGVSDDFIILMVDDSEGI